MAIGYDWSSGALPSQLRLAASTFLTRLPVSMAPLSLLLFVVSQTGSYAWAGLAAGAHVAGYALAAPVIVRRYSQIGFFRPMLACSIAYPLLAAMVIALGYSESAWWLVIPFAGAAGATLPVTHQVLAGAWHRLGEELARARHALPPTASSDAPSASSDGEGLEPSEIPFATRVANTVVSDAGALLGPLLVAVIVIGNSAGYAIGIAALAALVGSWLLISDPHAAAVKVVDPHQEASPITGVRSAESRSDSLLPLLISGAAALAASGALVVAVTGYARNEMGHPALAGVLLALWAVGGFVGGVWSGSVAHDVADHMRYRWTLALVTLAHLPLVFVDRTVVLVVLLPVAGGFAAANAAAYAAAIGTVASRVGAHGVRTRMAKLGYLGFGAGLAIGGIVLGWSSDSWQAFAASTGILVIAFLVGALGPAITQRWRARSGRHTGRHARWG
ncbi:MAG: hypothetical protein ACRDPW_04930 [Mycobacteriales bacterium]